MSLIHNRVLKLGKGLLPEKRARTCLQVIARRYTFFFTEKNHVAKNK